MSPESIPDPASTAAELLEPLRQVHRVLRDRVVAACEQSAHDAMSEVRAESAADTIYQIDRVSEEALVDLVASHIAVLCPILLVAEGLDEPLPLPLGTYPDDARFRLIVDPIDGTRGLMYQKRPAWILSGLAPNRGTATTLADIELAVQTEIPLVKQHLCDELWATKGRGAHAVRHNRMTGESVPLALCPSRADTLEHGFSSIARFFPGSRVETSAIDEEVMLAALGPVVSGRARAFEDQYISSGGQLYELMVGHDRFVADLRPTVEPLLLERGVTLGICSHPYDLCTELIAREAGVIVTDPTGAQLASPLTVDDDVAWVGYANPTIRKLVEPALQEALRRRRLIA